MPGKHWTTAPSGTRIVTPLSTTLRDEPLTRPIKRLKLTVSPPSQPSPLTQQTTPPPKRKLKLLVRPPSQPPQPPMRSHPDRREPTTKRKIRPPSTPAPSKRLRLLVTPPRQPNEAPTSPPPAPKKHGIKLIFSTPGKAKPAATAPAGCEAPAAEGREVAGKQRLKLKERVRECEAEVWRLEGLVAAIGEQARVLKALEKRGKGKGGKGGEGEPIGGVLQGGLAGGRVAELGWWEVERNERIEKWVQEVIEETFNGDGMEEGA